MSFWWHQPSRAGIDWKSPGGNRNFTVSAWSILLLHFWPEWCNFAAWMQASHFFIFSFVAFVWHLWAGQPGKWVQWGYVSDRHSHCRCTEVNRWHWSNTSSFFTNTCLSVFEKDVFLLSVITPRLSQTFIHAQCKILPQYSNWLPSQTGTCQIFALVNHQWWSKVGYLIFSYASSSTLYPRQWVSQRFIVSDCNLLA